jgi:predicted negative regulator of RcsB-dependent stress response
MKTKKQKQNNPWIMATLVLGLLVLLLIALNYYQERQLEKEKFNVAMEFMKFAQENQLEEICNIEQGVCCNTHTGECYEVLNKLQG